MPASTGSLPPSPSPLQADGAVVSRAVHPDRATLASEEVAAQGILLEDNRVLAQWREELEARIDERLTLQARHRDRLDDALDHLESLRLDARTRQIELDTPAPDLNDSADAGSDTQAVDLIEEAPPPEPFSEEEMASYHRPSLDLLRKPSAEEKISISAEEIEESKLILQETLDSFSIDAFVYDAIVGPRITQFRVKPGFGVRVESIAALEKNIALSMSARAVRIQAPIPGESFVGVETPNRLSVPLSLRGSFETDTWRNSSAEIPIVLGLDITGQVILCDLARAPHALIAGATGSGKSVCISNIILSLMYRFRPDELELVLVDPKIVEFAIYRDLPHLIHPVVTEPKQAVQALKWLVREMERRYEVLAEKHVRNLASFNTKAEAEGFDKLPYIVLIIDELADLMMTAQSDVETPIARLAQMSRAVGIHTILATQRPSVNVITGMIKANFPTRVAFQVPSQIDSRTILDGKGAEALQGRGDMLYSPPGLGRLMRLQAPYVDDTEIEKIVTFLKDQVKPRYRVELRAEDAPKGMQDDEDGEGEGTESMDPMLKDALGVVASHGRASTSYLQRKLKIGYNRAATLMEELETRHYIGPQIGNNPREIFIQPGDLK